MQVEAKVSVPTKLRHKERAENSSTVRENSGDEQRLALKLGMRPLATGACAVATLSRDRT